jgi:hypothetical protein
VSGHRRYTETGTDLEARVAGKAYDPVCGEVREFLCGAGGPLVPGEVHPHAISRSEVHDTVPDCVNDACTVLVGSYLRERRRRTVAGAKARLPVGGVDTGDSDANPDLTWRRLDDITIGKLKNRWVTGVRVDNRLHARDTT